MANKPSGLGRGLEDLLEDNTPSLRSQKPNVVLRKESEAPVQKLPNSLYERKTKPLFETKPRNKSLK